MIEVYCDGCCEPINPGGTAGFGCVVFVDGERAWEASGCIPPSRQTTNNVAEYLALIHALEWLIRQGWNTQPIVVYGDSQIVIQQQFGTWRIKRGSYVRYALKAKRIIAQHFPAITGRWIPREQNGLADELSKRQLLLAGVEFRIQPLTSAGHPS